MMYLRKRKETTTVIPQEFASKQDMINGNIKRYYKLIGGNLSGPTPGQ